MGEAAVPGDKSCSHRALILGAMAEGTTTIRNLGTGDDIAATMSALRQFGIAVDESGNDCIVTGGAWSTPESPIDCGNSGTTARLLVGAVAGRDGLQAAFKGDASLSTRPMSRLTVPLEQMGATFDNMDKLPIAVGGATLGGTEHENLPPSAQVKSAILLAALGTDAPVTISEPQPSRDHTEIMLHQMGCDVDVDEHVGGRTVRLGEKRSLEGGEITIGGDPSAAAFPLLGAAISPGSKVDVKGLNVNPLRTGFLEVLEAMGARIELSNEREISGEIIADVHLAYGPLTPCDVAADQIPSMIDEIPALVMACAFADGESVIEGLDELRHKESDRLGALVTGLSSCGVTAIVDGDAIRIFGRGRVPGGSIVMARGDHRIAMAFLTLGLASEAPISIDDDAMIATSYPGFLESMHAIGADIQ